MNPEIQTQQHINPPPDGSPPVSNRQWQIARSRLVGYLDAIGIPPGQALELASRALDSASDHTQAEDRKPPVAVAMQQLRQILAEQQHLRSPDQGGSSSASPERTSAVPELKPGPMRSRRLELYPGQTLLKRVSDSVDLRNSGPYMVLVLVLMFVYLFT